MESFFLPETSKYLYLLNSDAAALPDYYIFSTEGHLLPPFPRSPADRFPATANLTRGSPHPSSISQPRVVSGNGDDSSGACQAPAASSTAPESLPGSQSPSGLQSLDQRIAAVDVAMGRESVGAQQKRVLEQQRRQGITAMPKNIWNLLASTVTEGLGFGETSGIPSNCLPMCADRKEKDLRKEQRSLRRAFPLLSFSSTKSEWALALTCMWVQAMTASWWVALACETCCHAALQLAMPMQLPLPETLEQQAIPCKIGARHGLISEAITELDNPEQ